MARTPWWKKKRWAAAVLLLIIASYPLSVGPVFYCVGRGWVSEATAVPPYVPLALGWERVCEAVAAADDAVDDYAEWAINLGRHHAAAE